MTSWERPLTLRADRVLTPYDEVAGGWVTVRSGVVTAVGSGAPPQDHRVVELGDRLLAPGFVDLHVHGGGGAEVNGERPEDVEDSVRRLAAHHARGGTTALLATTVSDSPERLLTAVQGIAVSMRWQPGEGARVLGAHLEGPWLSPERAGAQDPRSIRLPDLDELGSLVDAAGGAVRLVTLAPELPGGLDLVAAVVRSGAVASIGHSVADVETALAALDAGASHVTHLFNGMAPLHHRYPGVAGVALTDPRVTVEVIADSIHVAPTILALVMRAAGGRVVAVTDAVAATGMPPGRYRLGGVEVDVAEDRAVLAEQPETLAGSVVTMDRVVANLVAAGAQLRDAVTAASLTPAWTIGETTRGRIAPGAAADLVVLDAGLTCVATVVGGWAVYDPHRLFGG